MRRIDVDKAVERLEVNSMYGQEGVEPFVMLDDAVGIVRPITQMLQEISKDICDNYCKYRDTVDKDCLCDVVRDGGECPLDRLY